MRPWQRGLHSKRPTESLSFCLDLPRTSLQLKDHDYTNIDGLDPSQGLLDAAMEKGLYRQTFCCYVTPDKATPVLVQLT